MLLIIAHCLVLGILMSSYVVSQDPITVCKSDQGSSGFCFSYNLLEQCIKNPGYSAIRSTCEQNTFCCAPQTAQQTQLQPKPAQCGIKGTDSRAIQVGTPPATTEYCWQVYIFQTSTRKFIGGGSLVNENSVVSSVSILNNIPENDLLILVGDLTQQVTENNPCVQYINVKSVVKHSQYNLKGTYENNVSVLKLSKPAQINGKCVCIICLPEPGSNFDGKFCTVTGVGKNRETDPDNQEVGPVYSSVLKVTQVPVINKVSCQYLINTYANRFFVLDHSHLCAGSREGQDACKGDGGGPLACDRGENTFVLTGIVSAGFGCFRPGIPGMYSNVASALNFIKTNI